MIVRVKSETATVIELEWDAVGGQEGYVPTIDSSVILTDGKRHPSTKQNATTVKIAKVLDGKPHAYGVNILGVVQQGSVTVGGPPPPPPPPPPAGVILGCGYLGTNNANWSLNGRTLSYECRATGGNVVGVRCYYVHHSAPRSDGYWNGTGGRPRLRLFADGHTVGQPYTFPPLAMSGGIPSMQNAGLPGRYVNGGSFPLIPVSGAVPPGAILRASFDNADASPSRNFVSVNDLGCPQGFVHPSGQQIGLKCYDGGSLVTHHLPLFEVVYDDGHVDGGSGLIDSPASRDKTGSADIQVNLPHACSQAHVYGVSNVKVNGVAASGSPWAVANVAVPAGPSTLRLTFSGTLQAMQQGTGYGFTPLPGMPGEYVYPVYLT